MKKKAPAGEQGAEDAEEEVEGEDTMDNKEGCGSRKKKGASYEEKDPLTRDTERMLAVLSIQRGRNFSQREDGSRW